MQTRKLSMIETATNQIIGILLCLLITHYLLPLILVEGSWLSSIGITSIYVVQSLVRSYTLRRLFTRLS